MSLRPGYNLVTDPIESTDAELGALSFFRRVAHDRPVETRVTVTGLETLLYAVADSERETVVDDLHETLRETDSLDGPQVVQFVFDGRLVDADVLSVDVDGDRGTAYLPVGNLFVESPNRVGAAHAFARK
ncbi:hypothetical protein [Halobaculum sp. MBLA0143]|uniref:hypothetical protein n=1 Tax=Halobaculum sp. MBLA0143 TaxID=3079933 RepID=UPI0035246575